MYNNSKTIIKTFDELHLSAEEREEKRKRDEKDKELADFYRRAFEEPEPYFIMNDDLTI